MELLDAEPEMPCALVAEAEATFEDDLEGIFWDERGFARFMDDGPDCDSSEDERQPLSENLVGVGVAL
jgi:hypothetical protein